jgi:hypothetical protein
LSSGFCFGQLISDMRSNAITYIFQWTNSTICRLFRLTSSVFILQNHLLMVLVMVEKFLGLKSMSRHSHKREKFSTLLSFSIWLLCITISIALDMGSYLGEYDMCFAFASNSLLSMSPQDLVLQSICRLLGRYG